LLLVEAHVPGAGDGAVNRNGRAYVEAAIRNRAFSLVYQPIVNLDSGTVAGVEALCRFDDGRAPDVWFRRCEALGLASAIDLAIIDLAFQDLDRLPPGYLALNLSAASLSTPGRVHDALRPFLPRRPIVLELTEHAVVDDYEVVCDELRTLRDAGVMLAVDDAGAGYATFQHVLRLRPDVIKLDRSITRGIDADRARRALVSALVIFGAEVRASVVAEGIETESELTAVRSTGVGCGQGYWLGRPSPLPLPPVEYRPTSDVPMTHALDPVPWARTDDHAALIEADPTLAVVAHGLLHSLATAGRALDLLCSHEGEVPVEEFRALVRIMRMQIRHVTGTLEDLVRGMPHEALRALDELLLPEGTA
jgi:EAL domain-containing protein (putative c-di-GMP-specific phosphodiesterase class I)